MNRLQCMPIFQSGNFPNKQKYIRRFTELYKFLNLPKDQQSFQVCSKVKLCRVYAHLRDDCLEIIT